MIAVDAHRWAGALPRPFDALPTGEQRALAQVIESPSDGSWVRAETSAEREGLLLVDGAVELRREGRLLSIVRAPATVELRPLLDADARTPGVRALAGARIIRLSLARWQALETSHPAFSAAVQRHLCAEIQRLEEEQLAAARSWDDVFLGPGARLPPGPYTFEEVDLTLLVMRGSADRLAGLLPSGLWPVPGMRDRYLVLVSDIREAHFPESLRAGTFRYREVMPLVPCLANSGHVGAFAPEIYPDAYQPILLGREIFGFPKRFGRTFQHSRGLDLACGGELVFSVGWNERTSLDAARFGDELWHALAPDGASSNWLGRGLGAVLAWAEPHPAERLPAFNIFVRKRISAVDGETLALDQLVEIPFTVNALAGFARLDTPFASVAADDAVLHGVLVSGLFARVGLEFHRGRVRRSFIAEDRESGRLADRLARALR